MNLISKIIMLLLSILMAILIILPVFIESKSVKIDLQNKLTNKFQTNFQIDSDISISFFPRPNITLNDVIINNFHTEDGYINIKFDSIVIIPTISSLFDVVEIDKIKFNKIDANYIISYDKDKKKKKEELIQIPQINQNFIANKIFNFDSSNDIFDLNNIKNIQINNSKIKIADIEGNIYSYYSNLDAKIYHNLNDGQILTEGFFMSDDIPTIFELDVSTKDNDISVLTIDSPILQGNISGSFFDSQELNLTQSNFDGKINLSISNLKLLLDKYFSQNNPIFNNINNTENINISANIFLKHGIINVEQIKIESDIINGSGKVIADPSENQNILESNFEIDYLNFDDFWVGSFDSIKDEYSNKATEAIKNDFNDIKDINYDKFQKLDISIFNLLPKIEIKIKQFKYNDQYLDNVDVLISANNKNQIKLEKLNMNIGEKSNMQITGIIENISSLIKLDGQLNLNSNQPTKILSLIGISTDGLKSGNIKHFQLNSKILLLPNATILKDVKAVLNKESSISGNSIIANNDDIVNYTHNYNFDKFIIDKYFLNNYLDKYIKGESFLKNIMDLNNIDANHKISLKFNQLSYKNFYLQDQSIDFNISEGVFDIPNLIISKGGDNSRFKFNLDVKSAIPTLNIDVTSDYIAIDSINNNPTSSQFRSDILNYFFDFPSLLRFDGNIDINIKNLKFHHIKLNNLIMKLPINEGVSKIEEISADIFGGNLEIKGGLIFDKQKKFNNSFKLINIDNKQFLNDLFNVDNIDSQSNIIGVIASNGKNKFEFLENINLQSNFNSSNINMTGFGITDLLRKINKTPYAIQNVENIVFSDSAKSYFRTISGKIDIKSGNKKRDFHISTQSLGMNSIAKGKIDLQNNMVTMGYNAIMVAMSKSRQKTPLIFALNASGSLDQLEISPNYSQIKQYLKIK